jgi:predicted aldo/keto reductase-like oxidoreductase
LMGLTSLVFLATVAHMSTVAAAAAPGLSLHTTVKLRRGTEMPLFGLGTWLSEGGGTCKGAVASALDHGYRLIDTATMYRNEADVGEALQEGSAEGVFIVSKLQPSDHGREAALAAIDKTLAELKVAKLDLWLMHSPSGGKVVETWKAMLEVRCPCACLLSERGREGGGDVAGDARGALPLRVSVE